MIQESYNLDRMNGMVSVVRRVILCMLGAEGIGAVCYAFCFVRSWDWREDCGMQYSLLSLLSVMPGLMCWERTVWRLMWVIH